MIKAIHPDATFGTNFSPVAAIAKPVEEFKKRGLEFAREQDDLDAYEYVALMIEDRGMLVLQHYLGASDNTVNLLLADDYAGRSDLAQTLRDISRELDVPAAAFHWRQNGEEMSLASARAGLR
jgi:hypothetical protein